MMTKDEMRNDKCQEILIDLTSLDEVLAKNEHGDVMPLVHMEFVRKKIEAMIMAYPSWSQLCDIHKDLRAGIAECEEGLGDD